MPPEPPAGTEPSPPTPTVVRHIILHVCDSFRTAINRFSILCEYLHCPSYNPGALMRPEDLANFRTASSPTLQDHPVGQLDPQPKPPWPFDNMSQFLLMSWHNNGSSQKTECELNQLTREVIRHPEFKSEDLVGFNVHQGHKQLDSTRETMAANAPFHDDSW